VEKGQKPGNLKCDSKSRKTFGVLCWCSFTYL